MSINIEKSEGVSELASQLGVTYTLPRVNLLPPEITAARSFRRVQVGLGGCVLAVAAGVVAAFLVSERQATAAAEELAAERATTASLQSQQAEFAAVPQVLAQVDAAQTARETALAGDVLWFRYLNDLSIAYPGNVWLTGVTATTATPGTVDGEAAVTSTDPLATSGIGSVSFTGSAMDNPDVANWLDVLAQTPGFADPALSTATRTERGGQPVVDFTSQVVVTDAALSHRFDRKAS